MSRRVVSLRGAAAAAFMNAAAANRETGAPLDEDGQYEAIAVYVTFCTKSGTKRDMAEAVACLRRLRESGPETALRSRRGR